jgi:hypothetical protein
VFVRNLLEPQNIANDDLLRLAVIMDLYQSPDVSHFCLAQFAARQKTDLASAYLAILTASQAPMVE